MTVPYFTRYNSTVHINNNSFQRNSNISRVVETIWRNSTVSRVEISRQLDLYRSTVSNIINLLLEKNVVIETESGASTVLGGRKPVFLTLNAAFGCVVGIEIQPHKYHAVAVDINSEIIYRKKGRTEGDTFTDRLDAIVSEIKPDIQKLNVPVLAVCTGMPGIIDPDKGRIIESVPLELHNLDFSKKFSERYGIPVFAENDARCCAWLDTVRHRKENIRDFIAVIAEYHEKRVNDKTRAGLSAGLAFSVDGAIRYGRNFTAGEFVSLSWRPEREGQTGLSAQITDHITTDVEAFKAWLTDFFATMTPIITAFAPDVLYLHGYPVQYKDFVLATIETCVPQFSAVLEKNGCTMEFAQVDDFNVACGAACRYLKKLFSVPDITFHGEGSNPIDWDTVFETVDAAHAQRATAKVRF